MANRQPVAFWSYSRFDDTHARGKLSAMRERLENEIRSQLGTPFGIFQDTLDLTWGAQWQNRLLTSIEEAVFFIPVITPNYFESPACRTELEAFLNREQTLLYEELILPVYWISADRPGDALANTITARNYIDCRKLRHSVLENPAMDRKIDSIAAQLIVRLKEFEERQGLLSKLTATITSPAAGECVARKAKVAGKTEHLPKDLTLWQVVDAGQKWHPQTHLDVKSWNPTATVGSPGLGENKDARFPIHIVATTKTAHDMFRSYLTEQGKTQKWLGIPKPLGTRVVATVVVQRDDQAVALRNLIGTYDEYRAKPLKATGGVIRIQGSAPGTLTVTATTAAGETEWTGNITVNPTSGETTGTYRYNKGSGQGTLGLQQTGDHITLTGVDRAAPAKPFHMTWRNRSP